MSTQATSHYAPINGLRMHYVEWGSAQATPMVCLHGLRAYGHWFDEWAAVVSDRYRVLALDQRGRGETDWASARRVVRWCAGILCRWRGAGCDGSPGAGSRNGSTGTAPAGATGSCASGRSSPWRASCSLRCGVTSGMAWCRAVRCWPGRRQRDGIHRNRGRRLRGRRSFKSKAARRSRGGTGRACDRSEAGFAVPTAPFQRWIPSPGTSQPQDVVSGSRGRHGPANRTVQELSAPLSVLGKRRSPGSPSPLPVASGKGCLERGSCLPAGGRLNPGSPANQRHGRAVLTDRSNRSGDPKRNMGSGFGLDVG